MARKPTKKTEVKKTAAWEPRATNAKATAGIKRYHRTVKNDTSMIP
jgi:hypothetical protein